MPRPRCCRRIAGPPGCRLFKPAGVPAASLQEIRLEEDELEALRLADKDGLYQDEAAQRMNVSRQTFGRIISGARRKVAQALVEGKAMRIEGGVVEMAATRTFVCYSCGHNWQLPFGTGRPESCPECGSRSFRRSEEETGPRGRPGMGRGAGPGAGRGVGRG
ncbi:MAG: DUF134 domain-containing protein, partial [Candidatus Eisenbacteria bacterium]|nr:DUF134 domain-containing protein [Candidatus Eisenbacteria bacterium]